jgi:hypothetical protein
MMVWFGEGKGRERSEEYYRKLWELLSVLSERKKEVVDEWWEGEYVGRRLGGIVGLLSEYIERNIFSFVILRGKGKIEWFPIERVKGVIELVDGEAYMFGGAFRDFCRSKGYRVGVVKSILCDRKILIPYFVGERIEYRTVRRFRFLGKKVFSVYRLDLRLLSSDGRPLVEIIEDRLKRR